MFKNFYCSFLLLLFLAISLAINPWDLEPEPGAKHDSLVQLTKQHANDIKVVFIGASLTEYWNNEGKQLWNSYYAPKGAYNYGVGGDSTSKVLWRIANHEFDGLKPKLIVLGCGEAINTLNHGGAPSPADVFKGMQEIIKQLRSKMPNAKILIISLTPVNDARVKSDAKKVNADLLKTEVDNKDIYFVDFYSHLVDANDKQKPELFRDDLVHFTAAGYQVWHDLQKAQFEKLIQ